jgi:hypothetical protein
MPRAQPYIALMEAYIKQLLDDIQAAHRQEEESAETEAMPWETEEDRFMREMEERFAEVERFIHEDPPHSLSYYCGLRLEQFPPAGQLEEEQVRAIIEGFVNMLRSWHIDTDIPDELPLRKAYTLLISLLNEHFWIDKWGTNTWSFCECEPSSCAYGAYCVCKEFEWVNELPDGDSAGTGTDF